MSEQERPLKTKTETKSKRFFSSFRDKLKRIKHLDIIVTILFVLILLLIYFSTISTRGTPNKIGGGNQLNSSNILTENETKLENYEKKLTNKITNAVSNLSGVGKVSVVLSFTEGIEREIAYTIETKTLSDGTKVEVKSPVFQKVNGVDKVVVLKEILPSPSSCIIVAKGADNTNVKLEILRLLQSMFELSSSKIEIFAGN